MHSSLPLAIEQIRNKTVELIFFSFFFFFLNVDIDLSIFCVFQFDFVSQLEIELF